MQMQPK